MHSCHGAVLFFLLFMCIHFHRLLKDRRVSFCNTVEIKYVNIHLFVCFINGRNVLIIFYHHREFLKELPSHTRQPGWLYLHLYTYQNYKDGLCGIVAQSIFFPKAGKFLHVCIQKLCAATEVKLHDMHNMLRWICTGQSIHSHHCLYSCQGEGGRTAAVFNIEGVTLVMNYY